MKYNDLFYICVKYFRLNVIDLEVPKPKFAFTTGHQFEKYVEINEYQFDIIVHNLKEHLLSLINVTNFEWKNRMKM